MAPRSHRENIALTICLLRFAIYIPFFVFSPMAINHANRVKANPVPLNVVYHELVEKSNLYLGIPGCFCIGWIFVSWFVSAALDRASWWGFFIFAAVDITIGGVMSYGLMLQRRFLPIQLHGCQLADEWQAPGELRNFFKFEGARLNQTAAKVCNEYIFVWRFAVALTPIMLIMGALAMIASISAIIHPGVFFMSGVSQKIGPVNRFTWRLLWKLASIHFRRCNPSSSEQEEEESTDVEKQGKEVVFFPVEARSSNTTLNLEDFLSQGQYIVLTIMATKLHYSDLLQLALASKRNWNAIAPHLDLLRRMTCSHPSTVQKSCWACNILICENCTTHRYAYEPDFITHLSVCKPRCSRCYYAEVCNAPYYTSRRGCTCQAEVRWRSQHCGGQNGMREVCSQCSCLTDPSLTAMREERQLRLLKEKSNAQKNKNNKRLTGGSGVVHDTEGEETCEKCNNELGTWGPRWWICSTCGRECRNAFHPAWAGETIQL